jgi:hypothetical protein
VILRFGDFAIENRCFQIAQSPDGSIAKWLEIWLSKVWGCGLDPGVVWRREMSLPHWKPG